MRPPLVVWQFTDGKPGHESQSRGLIAALRRRADIHAYTIAVDSCRCGIGSLLRRRHPCKSDYPPPDLILACGRSTHFAALAARRACGGKLVALMKPPLPVSLYDLCLVPEHDSVRLTSGNVVATRGVLNAVVAEPMTPGRAGRGLFLIGGPSPHYRWNGASVAEQIVQVLDKDPSRTWTLTTSRRTPTGFINELQSRMAGLPAAGRVTIVPVEQTRPGWVTAQLAQSEMAVASEDSVSMVYESLTSGVAVLLLSMRRRGRSRVQSGVEALLRERLVCLVSDYVASGELPDADRRLAEADRCADVLLDRWFACRMKVA
jgi:mitochondrial fission protein ELM1